MIVLVNVGSFVVAWVLLRVVFPPVPEATLKIRKELEDKIGLLQRTYKSLEEGTALDKKSTKTADGSSKTGDAKLGVVVGDGKVDVKAVSAGDGDARMAAAERAAAEQKQPQDCLEGESAGSYDTPWTQTFDLVFLLFMVGMFFVLLLWTYLQAPVLFSNGYYWLEQLPKVLIMMSVSLIGGWACRCFCEKDEKGYIITNKTSAFKVNYTRKLQHFAAYLVPLLLHTRAAPEQRGVLTLSWGNWVTLLGFVIMIKPLRERSTFVMLQFNALDRPEDRPNTLSWIVGGNIVPGIVMIIFFRWLYSSTGLDPDMTYIFLFITGIGDGLAEPVGIYFGKHKYWTTSCFGDRRYQRSLEGSACVFISSLIFCTCMWYTFHSSWQYYVSMVVLAPVMTYAEATSPHTIDTPFLMGWGGIILFVVGHAALKWH